MCSIEKYYLFLIEKYNLFLNRLNLGKNLGKNRYLKHLIKITFKTHTLTAYKLLFKMILVVNMCKNAILQKNIYNIHTLW